MKKKTKKFAFIGFLVGFLGTFLMAMLPFFLPVDVASNIFLFPARQILAPLNEAMSSWPGLINMLLAAVVNGIVYLFIFYVFEKIFGKKIFK
jgi:hypothetical protein